MDRWNDEGDLPQTEAEAIEKLSTVSEDHETNEILQFVFKCLINLRPDWSIQRCYFATICMGCKDGIEKATELSEGL